MWNNFEIYVIGTIVFWCLGICFAFISKSKTSSLLFKAFIVLGIISLSIFIGILWFTLERPPMRTLGETRLWYSFFLAAIGLFIYFRWKYKWLLVYSIFMASLFLIINLLHPETHSKALMPALQSSWFVPHVIVYMVAYAFLAASCILGFIGLYNNYKHQTQNSTIELADNIVYIGFSFLTLGLLFGALWAKEAWGHYWTWDPKEVWAFLTWIIYLGYIHIRQHKPTKTTAALVLLSISFVILLICWFGMNYLPIAKNSVHTYTN